MLFKLGGELCALPVAVVREMVRSQPVARLPGTKEFIRGVINLRGTILVLLDLRILLGMGSVAEEVEQLRSLLLDRQRDHEIWLDALEHSVRTGEPFQKATDPHQCAFGKWYDNYQTENLVMRTALSRLNAPHKAIHATAGLALPLAAAGRIDDALREVEAARHGALADQVKNLNDLLALGCETQRELVVVIEENRTCVGLCVDSIEGVEMLPIHGTTMDVDLGIGKEMVLRPDGGAPVRLFEAGQILAQMSDAH
ncbi:MAG: chemotaxis protein CheW [Myxococcales bacterium]|nr:chemotaxis protein CheW [Myxococcales bacterium]